MKLSTAAIASLATSAMASELVLYWGQASAGSQKSLGEYCDDGAGDIFVLSFIDTFGTAGDVSMNLGSADMDKTASDIKHCQSKGKKVLASLGGATATGKLSDDSMAKDVADQLWNKFGGGSGSDRPFGDAVVDGFDLDIESGDSTGWAALVSALRDHYKEDSSKSYYVSAAPQCVYPDASLGDALDNSNIDYAFIQFYNNPCAVDKSFNWDKWTDYAQNKSPNKDIKLFLGLPGATSGAGSGYVGLDSIQSTLKDISSDKNFGGVMFWDASQAYSNQVSGNTNMAAAVQNALGGSSSGSGSGSDSGSGSGSSAGSSASSSAGSSATASAPGGGASGASAGPSAGSGAGSASPSAAGPSAGSGSGAGPASGPASGSVVPTPLAGPSSQSTSWSTISSVLSTITSTTTGAASSAPAAPTGAQLAGGGGQGKIVTPDEADGDCNGKKGDKLASCLNDSSSTSSVATSGTKTATPSAPSASGTGCTEGAAQCQGGKFALCNFGKWVLFDCAAGTTCQATAMGDNAYVGCNYENAVSSAAPTSAAVQRREYRFRG